MITALITLAVIAVYLIAGWHVARRRLPRMWAASRGLWTCGENIRFGVKARFVLTMIFWPVVLPFGWLSDQLGHVVDSRDPVRIEREKRELQAEVARLERELGLR